MLLGGGAAAATAAWVTPVVLATPAHAQGSPTPDLFGVTGDGATQPETLYRISTADGSTTQVTVLGDGDDGEAIASDGTLLYHLSGLNTLAYDSIDPAGPTVTSIALSGDTHAEALGMVWDPGISLFRFADLAGGWFTISTTGTVARISADGTVPFRAKGLAFAAGTLYAVTPDDDQLHTLDAATGALVSDLGPITLAGFTVTGGLGLATDPADGTLYAALRVVEDPARRLATIDPGTLVATDIGSLGDAFAGLAFL